MSNVINFAYKPIPVHVPFHTNTAYERFLFGAFGSGKTWAICAEAIAWCLEEPGIRGMITRRTVPELRDTTETVFFDILPHELRKAGEIKRTGGHVGAFIFPNGSEVLFRAIDDWEKHKSLNIGFIAYDEMDEFDEETYLGMKSRVRQREPTPMGKEYGATIISKRGIWGASNPAGHNWCWKRAVNDATKADTATYFKSTSFDNPYLPPGYVATLLEYPPQWVRRYVLCQFDDFAGQIYESWNWDDHVITEPLRFDKAPTVPFWMGMDPGTRSPTAALWCAVDTTGELSGHPRSLIAVAEYKQSYEAAQDHAKEWRLIEAKHKMNVRWRVADPNSLPVRDRGSNMSLEDQYRRLGYRFTLGPSKNDDRIPMLGQLIAMKRFLVTPNCPMTYEAIHNYQWQDLTPAQRAKGEDPPEKPLKKDVDLVDCAQYLSSKWVRPARLPDVEKFMTPGQEVTRAVKRHLASKRENMSPVPHIV